MSHYHELKLNVFINDIKDPTKYELESQYLYMIDTEIASLSEYCKHKGDFTLQFCVFRSFRDLDMQIVSENNCSFGPEKKEPWLQCDPLEVVKDLSAYSVSIRQISDKNTKEFTVYHSENGADYVEVFKFEYPIDSSPEVAAFLYPKVSIDKPLDLNSIDTSDIELKMRLQWKSVYNVVLARSWKARLRRCPTYKSIMFYRLPNTTGRPEVHQYALVETASIDSLTNTSFRISVETRAFREIYYGDVRLIGSQMHEFRDWQPYQTMEFYLPFESGDTLIPRNIALQESFRNPLTPKGEASLASLRKFVHSMTEFWCSRTVYSPITSMVQSSGHGKSKLAYELLKSLPGIYFVFRQGGSDSGYPRMNNWSEKLMQSIFSDKNLPDLDRDNPDNAYTRVGTCLLYFQSLIDRCADKLTDAISQSPSYIDAASKEAKKHVASKVLREFALSQIECDTPWFQDIKYSTPPWHASAETILTRIETSVDTIRNICGLDDSEPFLLVFDELSILEPPGMDRLSGFQLIRQALRLLHPQCKLLALAIGTNSSTIEQLSGGLKISYQSSRSYSSRHVIRHNFMPPFVPGFNCDVLWGYVYDQQKDSTMYHLSKVQASPSLLFNPRFEQLLVSLGRPLWSSLLLSAVLPVAHTKLESNFMATGESILAMWAIRAGISIHPSHRVAKTMVKSLMATCFHSSPDGEELLIGYPSDPVLACAARQIMNFLPNEDDIYANLLKFYNSGAVDEHELDKNIAAMLVLRALDRATDCFKAKRVDGNIEGLGELNAPRNYIFEDTTDESLTAPAQFDDVGIWKVWTVRNFLAALYGEKCLANVEDLISKELLAGYMNISHFARTERSFHGISRMNSAATFIDHAILNWALLHQAGLYIPSQYYGIDLIIPVCLADGTLTYISIQIDSDAYSMSHENLLERMESMCPGLHHVSPRRPQQHGESSAQACEANASGEIGAAASCQHHLVLVMFIGNGGMSPEGFETNEVKLAPNIYGNRHSFESSEASDSGESLRKIDVAYIASLGEAALMSSIQKFYCKEKVQTAIGDLLSQSRDIFESRIGEPGFDRLVDYMQFANAYPEASTVLCRARGRPTAGLSEDSAKWLNLTKRARKVSVSSSASTGIDKEEEREEEEEEEEEEEDDDEEGEEEDEEEDGEDEEEEEEEEEAE